jgi:hypothetical protein
MCPMPARFRRRCPRPQWCANLKAQTVRLVLPLVLLAACSGNGTPNAPGPVQRNTSFRAVEAFAYTLDGAGRRVVRLQGINGTVRIGGEPGGSAISITGEREVRSDSRQDAAAHLQLLGVDIQESGPEILVSTYQPSNPEGRNYVVNYILTVPATVDLDVVNVNGHLDIFDTAGSLSARVTNGQVEASVQIQPGGSAELTTVNGDITLRLPSDTSAQLSARVVNGSITLGNLLLQNEVRSGTSLRGTLGGGNGTVSLQTTNGSIRVEGTPP